MSNQSQDNAIAKLQTAVDNFAKFSDSERLAKVTEALYECSLHVPDAQKFSTVSLKLKQAESAYYRLSNVTFDWREAQGSDTSLMATLHAKETT